ncbi:MAG: hypothetical protein LBF74_07840 [Treponema sp.]|nr:hypothetical protein [Treponema sp.]
MGWVQNGMSMGSAAAFMITGPATNITGLGAVIFVAGVKNFILYVLSGPAIDYVFRAG